MQNCKIFKLWFNLPEKLRFLLIGGFNTICSYLIFICFLKLLGNSHYQLSLFLSWVLSSVISFFTQKIFVWQTTGNYIKEYIKCLMTWGVGYVINAIILELFVKIFFLNVYMGQAFSILTTTIMSYVLFKKFVFKRGKKCQK